MRSCSEALDARCEHAYLLFVVASVVLVLVPGPDMALRRAAPTVHRRTRRHATLQLVLLGMTGNMLAIGINLGLVAGAARLTAKLRPDEGVASWLQRAMGLLLIGLGARLAGQRV